MNFFGFLTLCPDHKKVDVFSSSFGFNFEDEWAEDLLSLSTSHFLMVTYGLQKSRPSVFLNISLSFL